MSFQPVPALTTAPSRRREPKHQAHPTVTHTPDVCGGRACIANTRMPVWTLQAFWNVGTSDAELLASYPSLSASQLQHAREYIRSHKDEIERDLREQEADD